MSRKSPPPPPPPPDDVIFTTSPRARRQNHGRWAAATVPFERQLREAALKLGALVNVGRPQQPAARRSVAKNNGLPCLFDTVVRSPFEPLGRLENQHNTSINCNGKHERKNVIDFVLAYQRQRKVTAQENDNTLVDETERQRFYQELREQGIMVNVDDDPVSSLDAGRTCFALLQLSGRLLGCKCKCHTNSNSDANNDEDEETSIKKTNDVNYLQYTNGNGNNRKQIGKFTSAQRAQIVWQILLRIGTDDNGKASRTMSLNQLLETGIITAAYPVHDGNIKHTEGEDLNNTNDRRVLYEKWARPGRIIPRKWISDDGITALIRQYYGIPVAVYFCWLRYYTVWLVGPSIAGLVWFLYGLMTTRNDVPTSDICDPKSPVADWILCPTRRCDENFCGFTRVSDTCGLYRWTSAATFDRPGAIVFAVFMSFWATAFQQLWTTYGWQVDKRRGVQADSRRDDYYCADCCCGGSELLTGSSPAPVKEPKPGLRTPPPPSPVVPRPYADRLFAAVRAVAFLATLLAVTAVPVLIVVYRGRAIGWLVTAVFHQDDGGGEQRHRDNVGRRHRRHNFFLLNYTNYSGDLNSWKTAVATACAAFVQLTAIVAVHRGYSTVATWLTKHSYRSVYDPRFQGRYTAYMSCFDSANYYSSLVYIAFFKGRFAARGVEQKTENPSRISNFWPISLFQSLMIHVREDVCDPAAAGTGCVPELCTQLAIIMVGKQLVDNVIELTTPLALNVWRRWRAKESRRQKKLNGKLPDAIVETLKHPKQWQLDYQLEDTGPLGLYQEYSEMVIQYGFVVMFATAFPLAPLCALLNNVLERRLDAYKMVAAQRRPVPSYYCTNTVINNDPGELTSSCCNNCVNLGAWTRVLKVLSIVSVLYNAFMIAFTSDLLPRYVYSQISPETSALDGYVAWSLSLKRNMTEYYNGNLEDVIDKPGVCWYRSYGADSDSTHSDSSQWQVLNARLTFVIIFENGTIAAILGLAYFVRKLVVERKRRTDKKKSDLAEDRAELRRPTHVTGPNGDRLLRRTGPESPESPRAIDSRDNLSSVTVVDMENDDQLERAAASPDRRVSPGEERDLKT